MVDTMKQCREKWESISSRGGATIEEIEAIDKETPWREVEPKWWLQMMIEYRMLQKEVAK